MRKRVTLAQMRFTTHFQKMDELLYFSRNIGVGNFYFCSASTVVKASRDADLARILSSGFAIPDSTPLALTLRGKRKFVMRGTTFTREFCRSAVEEDRIFLVGSTTQVLQRMQQILKLSNNLINIVGTFSPSFQGSLEEKISESLTILSDSKPDYIFVALSSPQQDYFIAQISESYKAKYFAVGAAFDFIAENKLEAPVWLQKTGFEWLFRLISEPRRLWKRYLVDNVLFIIISIEFVIYKLSKRIKYAKK
jgi:N-acetylglucosaminyldiphosphoundecaprenol N-acetyl-beta-D-mannosaminyltransferase